MDTRSLSLSSSDFASYNLTSTHRTLCVSFKSFISGVLLLLSSLLLYTVDLELSCTIHFVFSLFVRQEESQKCVCKVPQPTEKTSQMHIQCEQTKRPHSELKKIARNRRKLHKMIIDTQWNGIVQELVKDKPPKNGVLPKRYSCHKHLSVDLIL